MTDATTAGNEAADTGAQGNRVEQRPRKKNLIGAPVEIDGQIWVLASLGFSPGWTNQRDRIYEESLLHGEVFGADVDQCAAGMLYINYDITGAELRALIDRADRKALVDAVTDQVVNLDLTAEQKGLTYYARTALRSAGLDPDKIPPEEHAGVLNHLVASGRVAPHDAFTRAGEFANVKAELLSLNH